ncbi:MAG: helix-turn-helix domain-containing protein [Verrucomicrobia bacterium]|nr:helix-turn-helix domain-containing protein [Verrucomicrobiota bacterium]
MAMTFHSVERLGAPFSAVSELGVVIPADGEVSFLNQERKLLFYLQGNCTGAIDGVGSFPIQAGDVLVVPCRCRQRYRMDRPRQSPRLHLLKIAFALPPLAVPDGRMPTLHVQGNPEEDLSVFARHHFQQVRHLPGAQTAPMQEILRAIRREAEGHHPGIRHRVRALSTNLMVLVARMVHERTVPVMTGAGAQVPMVNQVKEFLLRNHARELSLAEIAWHVRKSEEHIARVFRRVTGQTVFDYLRTIRLESAKTLLIDSDKTLTEIARLTGFGSLALFSRNFTHYVGRTASSYRQERARLVQWRPV